MFVPTPTRPLLLITISGVPPYSLETALFANALKYNPSKLLLLSFQIQPPYVFEYLVNSIPGPVSPLFGADLNKCKGPPGEVVPIPTSPPLLIVNALV